MTRRPRAATLAVGTEITDGQINDRNSSWISRKLTRAGVEVIEHRAVADDRAEIERALRDLATRVDVLFVTGGLGPTSDDFTREVLATTAGLELIFDDGSWKHIETRFASRGLQAKPIQRQQCFFPAGAKIMTNNAGTANAFSFSWGKMRVYAMPGPPIEIATVWAEHLVDEIEALTPKELREELHLIRTLGSGESAIAEIVEAIIAGSGLRVGYRAHVPYVEVKLWYDVARSAEATKTIDAVEKAIASFIVNRGEEDLADSILEAVKVGRKVRVLDHATVGLLGERLLERSASRRDLKGALRITSDVVGSSPDSQDPEFDVEIAISADWAAKSWRLNVKKADGTRRELEVKPTALYNFGSDRGRKYLTERVFQELGQVGL